MSSLRNAWTQTKMSALLEDDLASTTDVEIVTQVGVEAIVDVCRPTVNIRWP